jgi:hypothetical protein
MTMNPMEIALQVRGPCGENSPHGDGGGKEMLPASTDGAGAGNSYPHRGGDG